MNLRAAALLFLVAAVTPNPQYFRYDRPILNTPAQKQQTCFNLDPATFNHAGPQLASLRLYRGDAETPYAIDYAAPLESAPARIAPLNAGLSNGATTFDAAMPESPYSSIDIDTAARDFIATVRVSGSQSQVGSLVTVIGSYTIFDFTRQKLGRSTVLHLPQSDFRYLHFRVDGPIRPDQIASISTGRQPATEPQYVTVAISTSVQQKLRDSIIEFSVPAGVPVDQILFTPGARPVNFSREVTIAVMPAAVQPSTDAEVPPEPIASSGNLLRIHTTQNGRRIDEEHLAIDGPYQTFNTATKWTIAIHNEDDAPIRLQSVTLQMIARTLCFDAEPGASYKLYYGDSALSAPRYDYATLFTLDKNSARAALAPEEQNPQYRPRPDTRPFTERHPALLWIAMIAAILLLGVIALRSGKQLKGSNPTQ